MFHRRAKTKERYDGDVIVRQTITKLTVLQKEQEERLKLIEKELGVYRIRAIAS